MLSGSRGIAPLVFLIYLFLSLYLGWRLSEPVRSALRDGLADHERSIGAALCFMPMAWCVGYTASVTTAWMALQGAALFIAARPSVQLCAWLSLGALLVVSAWWRGIWGQRCLKKLAQIPLPWTALVLAIWAIAVGLTFGVTTTSGGVISTPQNLVRDLYSHTALIRSFSAGYNLPTEYPFFFGEPIRYHFLFYFGGGVLEALGAPLSTALNLPSALSLGSLLSFVAFLAWRLTGSLVAAALAVVFSLSRSSLSWIDWIAALRRSAVTNDPRFAESFFYGITPYEDWGIFSLNVHLNQRHLMHGFAWMLLVLVACLFTSPIRSSLRSPLTIVCCVLGVLLGCDAYWNGAAFMATMLALVPLVCVRNYRSKALVVGLSAIASSMLIVSLVTHGSLGGTPFEPLIRFGFLSESSEHFAVLRYAAWIFGVLPLVSLIAAWRCGARGLTIWLSGLMPIAFIFVVQITQVAPQGHKFINAGTLIWSIVGAGLVASLVTSSAIGRRLIGYLLVVLLTITGIVDAGALVRLAATRLGYPVEDSAIQWIRLNTPPDALFLSASRGDQAPLLAGRRVFVGPRSLSSEAGYPYDERISWLKDIAALSPSDQVKALREKGITHIASDVCRDVKGLISDPCPAIPETAALMDNPALLKLYSSSGLTIVGVPPN